MQKIHKISALFFVATISILSSAFSGTCEPPAPSVYSDLIDPSGCDGPECRLSYENLNDEGYSYAYMSCSTGTAVKTDCIYDGLGKQLDGHMNGMEQYNSVWTWDTVTQDVVCHSNNLPACPCHTFLQVLGTDEVVSNLHQDGDTTRSVVYTDVTCYPN